MIASLRKDRAEARGRSVTAFAARGGGGGVEAAPASSSYGPKGGLKGMKI